MEIKKNPKADLENRRTLYILLGLVFILSALFVAFEWTTSNVIKHDDFGAGDAAFEEEMIPITMQQSVPPPPPPPAPQVEEIINIVDDEKEIEEVEIQSTEDDQDTKTEIAVFGPPGNGDEEETSNEIFMVVENMPTFPGGEAALLQYIGKNMKYPVIAQENGIQGRVIVSFVIEKDGHVADVTVVRGVDPALDKEAIRVVSAMPRWRPGEQRGKPVRVKYTLPVTFRLN